MKGYFFLFFMVILLFSCNFQEHREEHLLEKSEMLIEQHPDSIFQLLTIEMHTGELNENLHARYTLLLIQAKDKLSKDISNDTLIFKTRDYFKKVNDKERTALSMFYSARVLALRKEKEKAMQMYLDTEEYIKETDNDALKGLVDLFIGELYLYQLLKDEAIEYYRRSSEFFKKANKYKNEVISYEKLGIAFLMKKEIDSCFYYYNKSLSLAQMHNDSIEQAFIVRNIGLAYNQVGELEKARSYLRSCIPYFDDDENKAKVHLNMAYSFNDGKNKDSTLYYVNKSLEYIEEENYTMKQAVYLLLSKIEEQDNNYSQALFHHKEYAKHLNRMFKETNNQAILDVQKKYDFELVRNDNNRLLMQRQSAVLVIFGLVILILLILFYFYKERFNNKTALADAEQKISQLEDIADSYDEKENSVRGILFQHFNILKKIALVETHLKEEEKKQGQKLLRKVNEIIYNDGTIDWDLIIQTIDKLYKGFPTRLNDTFPQLDEPEQKICCLAYAGLNNTEIAIIMALSVNTIQMKKSNIRKKLGIEGYGNIVEYLSKYLEC